MKLFMTELHLTNAITVHFSSYIFFCLFAIISKYILSKIFCMPMDFSLTVFLSICKVMYSFREKLKKEEKKVLL